MNIQLHLNLTLTFVFASTFCAAQLLPSRNMIIHFGNGNGTRGFLTSTQFFAEGERGFGSEGDDRAWDATIGGVIELYRWDGSHVLVTHFAQTTIANSQNDIHFNPRSAWWEENIGIALPIELISSSPVELGFTYRCKHDIDNSDPFNSDVPSASGPMDKRVVILGGLYVSKTERSDLGDDVSSLDNFTFDLYLLKEDNRFPSNNGSSDDATPPFNWADAAFSFRMHYRVDWQANPTLGPFFHIWGCCISQTFQSYTVDLRAEVGAHFPGAAGGIDAFAAWEHTTDDLSVPVPRSSSWFSMGMRIAGASVF